MDNLSLAINNKRAKVELKVNDAPKTISKIKSVLPQKIDLHYAKFAGEEVFGILPIMVPLENKMNVNNIEKGTVVYYPEKQFFCIYYGDLQEEDANVTVIGELIANEDFIKEIDNVRYNQGIEMIISDKKDNEDEDNLYFKNYKHLINTDLSWHTFPNELSVLRKRKGIIQPGGPIIYAEGETRKLADFLWIFYMNCKEGKDISVELLNNVLLQSINKIGGWCGLNESADVLSQYLYLIQKKEKDLLDVLEDMILFTNRLNMWIDLLIPWDRCNETMKNYYKDFY